MKYILLLIFLACAACERPVDNVARNLECEWVRKYKICICVAEGNTAGIAMTIAPNRVCSRIEMEPVEIKPESVTENSL